MQRPMIENALALLIALSATIPLAGAMAADPGGRPYPGYGYGAPQYMWRPTEAPSAPPPRETPQPRPAASTGPSDQAPPATPVAPISPMAALRTAPQPAPPPLAAAPRPTSATPTPAPTPPPLQAASQMGAPDQSPSPAAPPGTGYAADAGNSPLPAGIRLSETRLGEVLADQNGRTLYFNDRDAGGMSYCRGDCARLWAPLVTGEVWSMPEGFSLVQTANAQRQWAWHSRPLYLFAGDQAAAEVGGDGIDGVWHAARVR